MKVLKLFSVLIGYPQDELWENKRELLEACADDALSKKQQEQLQGFAKWLLNSDKLEIQSKWIELFDRGQSMSLLLFEHIHGESRDRGQAMVDLINAYKEKGFEIDTKELPDYLPLVLEFLSFQDKDTVDDWLKNISEMIALLATRAKERESEYEILFEILVDLSKVKFDWFKLAKKVSKEKRDDTKEEMDRVWMEEQVLFGPEDNAGGVGEDLATGGFNGLQKMRERGMDVNDNGRCNSAGRYDRVDNRKKIRIASQQEKK